LPSRRDNASEGTDTAPGRRRARSSLVSAAIGHGRAAPLLIAVLALGAASISTSGCDGVSRQPSPDSAEYEDPVAEDPEDLSEEEQATADWENRQGEAWDAYSTAFQESGASACQDFFNQTDNGSMYNDDYEYTATDCENAFDGDADTSSYVDVPAEPPFDPESDGADAGRQAACEGFFDEEGVDELYWGTDAYTADDCTTGDGASSYSGGAAPEPTPRPDSGAVSEPASAYERCDQNIRAKRGTTTCAFALNAFYEYWRSDAGGPVSVWSPKAGRYFRTDCSSDGAEVACQTSDGGVARFPQAAVDAYRDSQADAYRADADLGPGER
jgi:hypothetical protein